MLSFRLSVALVIAAAIGNGCGREPASPPRFPVTGSVTVNGEPLEAGRIRFSPLAGTATPGTSVGVVNGSYSTTVEEGLMVGSYRVEIEANENLGFELDDDVAYAQRGGKPLPPNPIPPQFNRNSTLEATVIADADNDFPFDLKFKPRTRK